MKYLKKSPVKITGIILSLLLASLLTASCLGGTYDFLGRTYQGAILQLTLEQIVTLDEVAYTEPVRSLIFQRDGEGDDDSLAGSSWTLQSLGELSNQALPIEGVDVTLEFMDGGAFTGNTGCNEYFSNDYIAAGGVFSAGGVGSTMMACEEPAGMLDQEARFLKLLRNAVNYAVTDDTLTLTVPVQDHVIRPSSEENDLLVIRTRIGNHAATRAQLDIDRLPPELRLDTGRFKSVNTFARGVPSDGFHANKNVYIPIIRGIQAVERGFELDGWMVFDVPSGSQVEAYKWEAGNDIIIIDN